jgi:hypothetical protein
MKRPENIEALLVDYAEGNLSSEDLLLVEAWLTEHPEDAELVEEWNEIRLPAEEVHKGILAPVIPEMEEWDDIFIQEIEGLIDSKDQVKIDEAVEQHPALQRERKLYALTQLDSEEVHAFPFKEDLIQETPVISLRSWMPYAAAASMVAVVASLFFFNQEETGTLQYAERTSELNRVRTEQPTSVPLPFKESTAAKSSAESKTFGEAQVAQPVQSPIEEPERELFAFQNIQAKGLTYVAPVRSNASDPIDRSFPEYIAYVEAKPSENQNVLTRFREQIGLGGEGTETPSADDLKQFAENQAEKNKKFRLDFEDGKLVAMGLPKLYWEKRD